MEKIMEKKEVGKIYLKLENGVVEKYQVSDVYKNNAGDMFVKMKKISASRLVLEYEFKYSDLENRNIFRPAADENKSVTGESAQSIRFEPR